MLEKLKELALRYEDLQAQLADPSVYGDADRLRTVNRELKELAPVAETYQAYRRAEADAAAAEALLSDPELRELAQEELAAARQEMERLRQELKLLAAAPGPQRPAERDPGDPGGHRRRGGGAVRRVAAADVHHVRRRPGLEDGHGGS